MFRCHEQKTWREDGRSKSRSRIWSHGSADAGKRSLPKMPRSGSTHSDGVKTRYAC